jgi:predicted  nucleic acid-binding Zn-ribbon protein
VRGRDHPTRLHSQDGRRVLLCGRVPGPARSFRAEAIAAALLGVLLSSQVAFGDELPTGSTDTGQSHGRTLHAERLEPERAQTRTAAAGPTGPIGADSDDVANVLSLLGTSAERRQLASELEELLRQGNLKAAEDRLNAAIELGSLAVLLVDRLGDPKFLAGLQALGIRPEERPVLPPSATGDPQASAAGGLEEDRAGPKAMDLGELQEAKEAKNREQQRADAIDRELASVREELRAVREREASSAAKNALELAELKSAFERERERADTATREREAVTEERPRLQEAMDREQQRANAIDRELAGVREELRADREREASSAAENAMQVAELKTAFERERERADAVTRELGAVTEERRTLLAQREQDSALIASGRKELDALKAALEEERRRKSPVDAVGPAAEQPPEGRIDDSSATVATASPPLASAPSSTASIPRGDMTAAASGQGPLRGVPKVLDTSTLSLQGRVVRLFGVETAGDRGSVTELTQYLGGREVVCEAAEPTDTYRCQVDGKDLSLIVLFNGGGWVTSDATSELKMAADRARSAGVGVWKNRSRAME